MSETDDAWAVRCGFSDDATRRAWELAIERSYRTIGKANAGSGGLQAIQKLAEGGDLIAIGIWNQFMAARLEG